MTKLKQSLDNLDELDAAFHPLYTEQEGKFVLTGVEGMKTDADIAKLNTALVKERGAHKVTKEKFALLGDLDIVDVLAKLDKIPELEAAAAGKLDDAAIQTIVETRLKARLSPVERLLDQEKAKRTELEGKVSEFTAKEKREIIRASLLTAATAAKVLPHAIDDVLNAGVHLFEVDETGAVVAKEGSGITTGIDTTVWLSDVLPKKPHWQGQTSGGGAQGSSGSSAGKNPWTADNWNMTEQGKIVRENPTRAEQLAKLAGTRVGGTKPVKSS